MDIPIAHFDLSSRDTYQQVLDSLVRLQEAADLVLDTVTQAVQARSERLSGVLERIQEAQERLAALSAAEASEHLAVRSPLLSPALARLTEWQPLFPPPDAGAPEGAPGGKERGTVLPTGPPPEGRLRGQETAELLHFFREAQACLASVTAQTGPPVGVPSDLRAALNLPRPSPPLGTGARADPSSLAPWSPPWDAAASGAPHSLLHGRAPPGGLLEGLRAPPESSRSPAASQQGV